MLIKLLTSYKVLVYLLGLLMELLPQVIFYFIFYFFHNYFSNEIFVEECEDSVNFRPEFFSAFYFMKF